MRMLAVLGVALGGVLDRACRSSAGASTARTAAVLLAVVMGAFGIGECIHGAVQAPLVTDLAEPRLLGRYMALSALSWQLGFALGPAVGGSSSRVSPLGTWLVWAGALRRRRRPLDRPRASDPTGIRRTPVAQPA